MFPEAEIESKKKTGKYKRVQNPIRCMLNLRVYVQEIAQIWKEMLCSARDFVIFLETSYEDKDRDYEEVKFEADLDPEILEDELTQRTKMN